MRCCHSFEVKNCVFLVLGHNSVHSIVNGLEAEADYVDFVVHRQVRRSSRKNISQDCSIDAMIPLYLH